MADIEAQSIQRSAETVEYELRRDAEAEATSTSSARTTRHDDACAPPPHVHAQPTPCAVRRQMEREAAANRSTFAKSLRNKILNFTPSWFSAVMGVGVTSVLLHQLPYQFKGLGIISNVVFGFNVLLFILFNLATATRYILYPQMWRVMILHPAQSLFLGTWPMALGTIVNMIVYSIVPAWGASWVYLAWSLWWIQTLASLLTAIGLPFLQFTRHPYDVNAGLGGMAATWLLPIVAPVVSAASGSIVAGALPPAQARLTIVISYIVLGCALMPSFCVFGILWARLTMHKLPSSNLAASAFLPIGPMGLGGFSFMNLASVSRDLARRGEMPLGGASLYSNEEAVMMVNAVYAISIIFALLLWGGGLVWLVLAVCSVGDMAYIEGGLSFNLGMWGFVFPLGVWTISTLTLGKELDSGFFKILGTFLTGCVTLLCLTLCVTTAYKAATGELFFSPCLAEIGGEDKLAERAHDAPSSRKYPHTPRDRSGSRPAVAQRSSGFSLLFPTRNLSRPPARVPRCQQSTIDEERGRSAAPHQ